MNFLYKISSSQLISTFTLVVGTSRYFSALTAERELLDHGLTVCARSGRSGAWGPCCFGRLRVKAPQVRRPLLKFIEIDFRDKLNYKPIVGRSL